MKEVLNMIRDIVGEDKALYFDTPVRVRPTPHMPGLDIDAVVVKGGVLWILDRFWTKVEPDNVWLDLIHNSLYQRLSLTQNITE